MTRCCDRLGIDLPIVQAPIGNACTPELVAAVSQAGGLGMFAGSWRTPPELRRLIRETRSRTARPFGVNLVLEWPEAAHESLTACMEEGVHVISLCWGNPGPFLRRLDGTGAITMMTVGSADDARRAADQGIDIVVAQGYEAGGHVWGRTSTMALVPAVRDAVSIPLIAAGGIGDGRGIAAALSLGADGAWMGTRFLATRESAAHPAYKQAIIDAAETATVLSQVFDRTWPAAPHRALRNATLDAATAAPDGDRPGTADVLGTDASGGPVYRYDDAEPLTGWTGQIGEMCLYAGESCGVVTDLPPAAELVPRLWRQAAESIHGARAADRRRRSSA
jgi:NAD(P)H-dependent flavin oxidoreductase YrpB (nitropropane dioxygenase family)